MTMTEQPRQSAGAPTGGQFAPKSHDEADVALFALDAAEINPEGYTHFHGSGEQHGLGDVVDIDGELWQKVADGAWKSLDSDAVYEMPIDEYDRTLTFDASTARSYFDQLSTSDIAGYTWRAENYKPEKLIEAMIAAGELSPGARGMTAEDALDQHAGANAIDRADEHTFDSDDFPKVIFGGQVALDADSEWMAA